MALPTKLVSWNFSLLNRISYTSLVQVSREVMFTVVKRLIAEGYTVKGSSNGSTAGMDGTDRWTTAADAGTRGTTTTTPVSWFVLTDANGTDIAFSFVGAADDVWRISTDWVGAFAAAGTATHTPTSASEVVSTAFTASLNSIVGSGTSGDRLVSIWTRPDSRGFRVAIARSNAWQSLWGVDTYTQNSFASGVTLAPTFSFYMISPASLAEQSVLTNPILNSSTNQWFRCLSRRMDSGNNLALSRGMETFGGDNAPATTLQLANITPELFGGTEYMMRRMSLASITSPHRGRIGTMLDWWHGRPGGTDGDTIGNREFIFFGGTSFGLIWPWDGTSSVLGTAVVMS